MKKIINVLKWLFGVIVTILGVILLGKPRDLHEAELQALEEEEENLKKDLVRQCNTAEDLENKYEEWLNKWHE